MEQNVSIGTYKSKCYELCQKVVDEDLELIVTKHGKPLVRVKPYKSFSHGTLNALKGTAILKDDLIKPIESSWSVGDV